MPSPILARADALMQRRHQNNAEQNDLPILTDAIEDENDDDLPVLNDIAIETAPTAVEAKAEDSVQALSQPDSNFGPSQNSESLISASELARQVEQRILAQLPQLIDLAIKDLMAEREITAINQEHN
jgi:hypothetical protein